MKVLAILLAFVCLASASLFPAFQKPEFSNLYNTHLQKLGEIKRGYDWLKTKSSSSLETVKSPSSSQKRQETFSPECWNELSALIALVNSTSCNVLEDLFDNIATLSETEAANILSTQCESGGCLTDLSTTLLRIQDECPAEIFDNEDDVKTAVAIFQIPCIQFEGTYCFSKFAALAALNDSEDDLPTVQQLDALCHPCIRRVLQYLVSFAAEDEDFDFGFLDLVCLRENNQYCFVTVPQKFQQIENQFGTEGPDGPAPGAINAYLTLLCEDRCFSKFAAIALAYDDENEVEDDFFTNFNGLCLQNNGRYCLSITFDNSATIDNLDNLCGDYSSCTGACRSSIEGFVDALGCCFDFFVQLVRSDNETDQSEVDAGLTFFQNSCGVTLPQICDPPAIVRITFTVRNLNFAFVSANRDLVERKLKVDISAATGVKTQNIEITSIQQVGNGVLFEVTLKPDNFAQEVANDFEAQSETFQFGSLSTLPASARTSPLEPFGVADVETSVEETNSGAVSITASLLLLLVALFFMQTY